MITIGSFTFPETLTTVEVAVREVLSRLRKEINIWTVFREMASTEALLGAVSDLEAALSQMNNGEVNLSLSTGRYYRGYLRDFSRCVMAEHGVATALVKILTEDRFERSSTEHNQTATINLPTVTLAITNAGNTNSLPRVRITAQQNLVSPQIGDGNRSLVYNGTLATGDYLELDGDLHTAALRDGSNVLSNCSGTFPELVPGASTISYSDAGGGTVARGTVGVWYRDWWV